MRVLLKQLVGLLDQIRTRRSSKTNEAKVQEDSSSRDCFRFAPELFETRTDVIDRLEENGFLWLSHYSSVDPIHDIYGIEVCGIKDLDDAREILNLLLKMFPDWHAHCLCYKDYGREPGFRAKVCRDNDRPYEKWETSD